MRQVKRSSVILSNKQRGRRTKEVMKHKKPVRVSKAEAIYHGTVSDEKTFWQIARPNSPIVIW
jgi:hypothetical protein